MKKFQINRIGNKKFKNKDLVIFILFQNGQIMFKKDYF